MLQKTFLVIVGEVMLSQCKLWSLARLHNMHNIPTEFETDEGVNVNFLGVIKLQLLDS